MNVRRFSRNASAAGGHRALAGLAFILAVPAYAAGFPAFEPHVMGLWGNSTGQTALADIDQDGDPDWVVGQRGEMVWFEFRGADDWVRHELGKGAKTDVGGAVLDINGDGWLDVIAGTAWYRNPRKPLKKSFKCFPVGTISCHDDVVADVNGDGRLDVIACSNDQANPRLVWYAIPENPEKAWAEYVVGEGIHGGVDPAGFGDLDGDGDLDIVRGDAWFENASGDGKQWRGHPVLIPPGGSRIGQFGLCLKSWVIDLDRDGDLDVIEAEADFEDCRVLWFENRDRGATWQPHLISPESTGQDFHSLAVADFDNDGDPDVFSGGGPLSKALHCCYIWENADGRGGLWKRHNVLTGERCHEAKAADVDGDGDVDICFKPWQGSRHIFLENRLVSKRSEAYQP
ncbi:MAG: VCBS repeat-containing protein [Verrucomicrobiales bacterium]|nr:VCBS repeat-containing protein [Verrucomicrobiales bacterium]